MQTNMNDAMMGATMSSKVPPAWDPARDRHYSFRHWLSDLRIWNAGTELDEGKRAAAVAMRLQGVAREIAREMDPTTMEQGQVIIDGGMQVQISGLEALIRLLRTRYALLPQEQQIATLNDVFKFQRNSNESIDDVLVRWEIVKFRASAPEQAGNNLLMNECAWSWLLLNILRIPPSKWDLVLAPTRGSLPADPQEYRNFIDYIRRTGHIYETGGMKSYFGDLHDANETQAQTNAEHRTTPLSFLMGGSLQDSQAQSFMTNPEDDSDFSPTSSEDEEFVPVDSEFPELQHYESNTIAEAYLLDYKAARKNFRRFRGRGRKGKGKGKGHFRKKHKRTILFGKDGERKNPVGRDGKIMKCSTCGSEFHFRAKCPQGGKGGHKYGGAGQGKGSPPAHISVASSSSAAPPIPPPANAPQIKLFTNFLTEVEPPRHEALSRPLFGMDLEAQPFLAPEQHDISGNDYNWERPPVKKKMKTIYQDDLPHSEGKTYLTEEPEGIKPRPQMFAAHSGTEVTEDGWYHFHSNAAAASGTTSPRNTAVPGSSHQQMPQRNFFGQEFLGRASSGAETPTGTDPTQLQEMTDLLNEEIDHRPEHNSFMFDLKSETYHSTTRLSETRDGLLIDVGAVENLMGERWAQRVARQAAQKGFGSSTKTLLRPISIEGCGTGANEANKAMTVPICLPGGLQGVFESPMICDSDLPALLGLTSLTHQRALIDTVGKKLICVGAGGYEIRLSAGSRVYDLESSPSGHLLLPCTEWHELDNKKHQTRVALEIHHPAVETADKTQIVPLTSSVKPNSAELNLATGPKLEAFSWVIGEEHGYLQRQLSYFTKCTACIPLKLLTHPNTVKSLLQRLHTEQPAHLWIRLPGVATSMGNHYEKIICSALAKIIEAQLKTPSCKILMIQDCYSKIWHQESIAASHRDPRLVSSQIKWCALALRDQETMLTFNRTSKTLSNYHIPESLSTCCGNLKHIKIGKVDDFMLAEFYKELVSRVMGVCGSRAVVIQTQESSTVAISSSIIISQHNSTAESMHPHLDPEAMVLYELGDHEGLPVVDIPKRRGKVKQILEDHFDDCGDADEPLHEVGKDKEPIFVSIADDSETDSCCEENSENEGYEWDSDFEYNNQADDSNNATHSVFLEHPDLIPQYANFHEVLTYLNQLDAGDDFCEIFGGTMGTTKLGLRRRLKCGKNFDLTCQINLLEPKDVALLWSYLKLHRPKIVVCHPPCTAFSQWQNIWKYRRPTLWKKTLAIGIQLAELTASVCKFQLKHGYHFIIENPAGSKLWALKCMTFLEGYSWALVHQCMFNLRDPDGFHTRKSSWFAASCETLIYRLRRTCDGSHVHVQLAGSTQGISRTKYAQVWTPELCQTVVAGVMETLKTTNFQAYPVVAGECDGCRRHLRRDNPLHNRDPTHCRFPMDESTEWHCEACKRNAASHNPAHTQVVGECQWATASRRAPHVRRGHHPRDGREPVAADPATAVSRGPREEDRTPTEPRPPPTAQGEWTPVSDLSWCIALDSMVLINGWQLFQDDIPCLVTLSGRILRTAEPRYDKQVYRFRTTFGYFHQFAHAHGQWWNLEQGIDTTEQSSAVMLPYPVAGLVQIFHRDADLSSLKNITPNSSAGEPKASASSSSGSRPTASGSRPVPAQQIEGAEREEHLPPVARAQRPDQEPEDPAAPAIAPDWSSWDLGKALTSLKGNNVALQRLTLKKLHLRWWHCSAARMSALLRAAGVNATIISMINGIVDTCTVCRMFNRPKPRSMTSNRLATQFNQVIQLDLMFIYDFTVLHIVDECLRYSAGQILPDRQASTLVSAITNTWFRLFGPPQVIIADHEGGLNSEIASIWAERWGFSLRYKPKNSHAWLAERHHEILRQQCHKISEQLNVEGIVVPFSDILAEALFAKNTLLNVGGTSPQVGLTGRQPAALSDFDNPGLSTIDDGDGSALGSSQHAIRLREIALEKMISATASERASRAIRVKTKTSAQVSDYQVGERVEIYRYPKDRDTSGWRGPCEIVSIAGLKEGFVDVRWQNRVMSSRLQDTRRCVMFFFELQESPYGLLIQHLLTMPAEQSTLTLSWILGARGWQLSKGAQEHPELYRAGLLIGTQTLHMVNVIGCRIGRGVSTLGGLYGMGSSILIWMPADNHELTMTLHLEGQSFMNLRQILGEEWLNMIWMQFLSTTDDDHQTIQLKAPDEPLLSSQGASVKGDYDESMPKPPSTTRQSNSRKTTPVVSGNPMSTMADTIYEDDLPHSKDPDNDPSPQPPQWKPSNDAKLRALPSDRIRNPKRPISTTSSNPRPLGQAKHTSSAAATSPTTATEPIDPPNNPDPAQESDEGEFQDAESLPSTIEYEHESFYGRNRPPLTHGLHVYQTQRHIAEAAPHSKKKRNHEPLPLALQRNKNQTIASFAFSWQVASLIPDAPTTPMDYELIYMTDQAGETTSVIARTYDELSKQEVKDHWPLVEESIKAEIQSFQDCKTFEPVLRSKAVNLMDSRFVLRWKQDANGNKMVKSRLTVKGFKDMAASSLETFAGTCTRWGQRLICHLIAQNKWELTSMDISTAFLQGVSFEELSEITGEPLREVCFTPPPGSEKYFEAICPEYTPSLHVLRMLKAVYGLKDAPRAWRIRLHRALVALGGRQLVSDPAIYVWLYQKDKNSNECELLAALSTHVDDLKGGGQRKQLEAIIKGLEQQFGQMKLKVRVFEHCGILHEQDETMAIKLHQSHYVKQLHPMDTSTMDQTNLQQPLTSKQLSEFLSLLGALAWLVQTRLDIAIYICALQRRAKSPCVEHALRLNRVLKWCRRKPYSLIYQCLQGPLCVATISDSAFRKEDTTGLAMRGAIIGIKEQSLETAGGRINLIDFYSRKQKRITRSTFAAEAHALVDSYEISKLIAFAATECTVKINRIGELLQREAVGELSLPIECTIDAKSVFDALKASEIKPPTESSLILILLVLKEGLLTWTLKRLWWCDTRDMCADGLNKGIISRQGLHDLCSGEWKLAHKCIGFSESKQQKLDLTPEIMFRFLSLLGTVHHRYSRSSSRALGVG